MVNVKYILPSSLEMRLRPKLGMIKNTFEKKVGIKLYNNK